MGAASDTPTIYTGDIGRPVGRPYVALSVPPRLGGYKRETYLPFFCAQRRRDAELSLCASASRRVLKNSLFLHQIAHGGAGTLSFPPSLGVQSSSWVYKYTGAASNAPHFMHVQSCCIPIMFFDLSYTDVIGTYHNIH